MKKNIMLSILFILICFSISIADEITISAVGDVNPQILKSVSKKQLNRIRNFLGDSDVIFGNLESPITTHPVRTSGKKKKDIKEKKDYVFKSDPATVNRLVYLGFNVFALANNHMMDYCEKGLNDTIYLLNRHKIKHCGAGKNISIAQTPVIIKKRNVKIAFIAYSEIVPVKSIATANYPGIAGISYPPTSYDFNNIKRSIISARKKGADIVIVSLHWGKEKSSKMEEYQVKFTRKILDSGADCIIGHHPHILRSIETYKGKIIAYSLGNFIFGTYGPTIVLKIKFKRDKNGNWKQSCSRKKMYVRNGVPE
ncbi:MAG: CapA family protein [Candidatus Eremiobacteraeota bacterium]|nr:CapA family protein [Candidatus Eremiobacteraeota bacterium]